MDKEYNRKHFVINSLCYDAKSISEANVLVLWGSISKKLAEMMYEHVEVMSKNRFIIHIRGCNRRVENKYSSSSLVSTLPINAVHSDCILSKRDYRRLINEARQCS
jgi:hypothetical protein